MGKHTPGPWEWDGRWLHGNGSILLWYTIDDNGVHCGEADARLIAAAPELLGCCIKALAAWEGTGPAILLDDLRAAIAKATGEQP